MTVALLKDVDGSIMLPLTAEIVSALSLTSGSSVEIDVQDGQFTVHINGHVAGLARRIPKFTMDELLADYDQIPKDPEEDRIWLNSPPVGRELI